MTARARADTSHRLHRQRGAVDPREREDAVDELGHALGAAADAPQVVQAHRVQLAGAVLASSASLKLAMLRSGARKSWATE